MATAQQKLEYSSFEVGMGDVAGLVQLAMLNRAESSAVS